MTVWVLLAVIWLAAGALLCCFFSLLRMWLEHRATWGAVYEHHNAMDALREGVRHG